MSFPKSICFVDDDPVCLKQWREWCVERAIEFQGFGSCYDAAKGTKSVDMVVIDISAASASWTMSNAYAPIAELMLAKPKPVYVIGSCASTNFVTETIDDIEAETGTRPRFFDASSGYEGLERIVRELANKQQ